MDGRFGNPLVGEAYGGLFQPRNFTMVRRICCYGLGCSCCDDSKPVIAVSIVHQLEASNVGADPCILPSSPCFLMLHSFLIERVTNTLIHCLTSRLLPSNNQTVTSRTIISLARNLFFAMEPSGHSIRLGNSFL